MTAAVGIFTEPLTASPIQGRHDFEGATNSRHASENPKASAMTSSCCRQDRDVLVRIFPQKNSIIPRRADCHVLGVGTNEQTAL
jgi:hypothetical protein